MDKFIIKAASPDGTIQYVGAIGFTEKKGAFQYNNRGAAIGGTRYFTGSNCAFWQSERESAARMKAKYAGWQFEVEEV